MPHRFPPHPLLHSDHIETSPSLHTLRVKPSQHLCPLLHQSIRAEASSSARITMGSPKKGSAVKGLAASGGDSPRPTRTAAELAREKKLRDDPMAEVHGPLFVTCKRCGNRIKLSPKSSYDPFHWTKHRERCLRKPVGQAQRHTPKETTPPATKKSSPSSSNTDGDNVTPPPLTPQDERATNTSDVLKLKSPSPHDDINIPTHSATFPVTERWQSWNWSELRYPKWLTDTNLMPVGGEQDDVDVEFDDTPSNSHPERSPTSTLSLHPGKPDQDNPSLPT